MLSEDLISFSWYVTQHLMWSLYYVFVLKVLTAYEKYDHYTTFYTWKTDNCIFLVSLIFNAKFKGSICSYPFVF